MKSAEVCGLEPDDTFVEQYLKRRSRGASSVDVLEGLKRTQKYLVKVATVEKKPRPENLWVSLSHEEFPNMGQFPGNLAFGEVLPLIGAFCFSVASLFCRVAASCMTANELARPSSSSASFALWVMSQGRQAVC